MPNRGQRRGSDPTLDKWLHVEDADGNPYDIHMRDISGKDEFDFLQAMTSVGMSNPPGLTDLFLKGEVTLVGIAGLIWAVRRRFERKLNLLDVLKTVNMATIETMDLHDPAEDENEDGSGSDDPDAQLAKIRMQREAESTPMGFDDGSPRSSPDYEPSTG